MAGDLALEWYLDYRPHFSLLVGNNPNALVSMWISNSCLAPLPCSIFSGLGVVAYLYDW